MVDEEYVRQVGSVAQFLKEVAESDPKTQALKRSTLKSAKVHLRELLYEQRNLALNEFGIPKDAEVCTEGITYLTWPAQFKVSGVTVVDMKKVPEDAKLNFGTDYAAIHHGCEYVIKSGVPERCKYPDFSEIPLKKLPKLFRKYRIREMATMTKFW